jgi:GNAT superfamily N-acetyltransferase
VPASVEQVTIDSELCAGDLGRIVEQHGRVYRAEHGYDSSARGRGLGRRLLDAALAHSAEVGFERVFLWTVTGLEASADLYRRAGFVEVEPRAPAAPWGVEVTEVRFELARDVR